MTIEAPALRRPIGGRYDRQFYTGMAIAAAVVVFAGFAPTYFLRASYQTTPLPTYPAGARLSVHDVDRALHRADVAGGGATDERASSSGVGDGGARRGDGRRRHDGGHLVDAPSGRGRPGPAGAGVSHDAALFDGGVCRVCRSGDQAPPRFTDPQTADAARDDQHPRCGGRAAAVRVPAHLDLELSAGRPMCFSPLRSCTTLRRVAPCIRRTSGAAWCW